MNITALRLKRKDEQTEMPLVVKQCVRVVLVKVTTVRLITSEVTAEGVLGMLQLGWYLAARIG